LPRIFLISPLVCFDSFESFSKKLGDQAVIDASADMLLRIIQLLNWRRGDNLLIQGTVRVPSSRLLG